MTWEKRDSYSLMFPRYGSRLHSMTVNCGHESINSAEYSWNGMQRGSHELLIWQYTLAGQGALDFGGRTIPLVPGRGFLLVVPEQHRYYLPENSPGWEFIFASFNGSEVMRIAGECRRRSGPVSEYDPEGRVVRMAWQLLDDCRNGRIDNVYTASAAAYNFMMALLEAAEHKAADSDEMLVSQIHDYCLQNISSRISVEDVAEFAGLSRWHLSRRFQQAYGKPLHDFIVELKMRMALRRLQSSRDSVKEIAVFCGFDDPSYFCKVFKRIYGTTPGEFRSCTILEKNDNRER